MNLADPTDPSVFYALGTGLNMTGVAFTPIGNGGQAFAGNFDGYEFSIINLTCANCGAAGQPKGLFEAVAATGVVQNVGLGSSVISGGDNVGGIAGTNTGTIEDILLSNVQISGNTAVGGVVGLNNAAGTVEGVYVNNDRSGNVILASGSMNTGGIVGDNRGAITDVTLLGSLDCDDNCGGIAGSTTGPITQVRLIGQVVAESGTNVGGAVGLVTQATVSNVGVALGVRGGGHVGGVVGRLISGTLQDASFRNAVNASDDAVGGIVGRMSGTALLPALIERVISYSKFVTIADGEPDPPEDFFWGGVVGRDSANSSVVNGFWRNSQNPAQVMPTGDAGDATFLQPGTGAGQAANTGTYPAGMLAAPWVFTGSGPRIY